MLSSLIRRLRRQPEPVREQVALWSAGGLTALVALVWLYHVPQQAAPITQEGAASSQAFSQFVSEAGSQLSAVREVFSGRASGTAAIEATTSTEADLSKLMEGATTSEPTSRPANPNQLVTSSDATATTTTGMTSSHASGAPADPATEPRPVRIMTVPAQRDTSASTTATGTPVSP